MANRNFSASYLPGFTETALIAFALLYLPIAILVAHSFTISKSSSLWEGMTLDWYRAASLNEPVQSVTLRSLIIALSASSIATFCATLAALGTTRRKAFRGQTFIYVMINQPLMVPEIVTAVALLIFFASIKVMTGYQGLGYPIAAHLGFCIPFAYLPIRARLEGMDLSLETAAADLYATLRQTFRFVTLPLLAPGIIAGAMLGSVISLDDVVITEFNKSGGRIRRPPI